MRPSTYFIAAALIALSTLATPLTAQINGSCADDTTIIYTTNYINREHGNSVYSYAEMSISGNLRTLWVLHLGTWLYTNGTYREGYNDIGSAGGNYVFRWVRRSPQDYGVGTYRWDSYHRAFAQACNQWAPPYKNGWNGNSTSSLVVERPTVSLANPIHWLGNGVLGNFYYKTGSGLTADAKGAPGTPTWLVTSGSEKVTLSSTQAFSTVITARQPSSGCIYDVVVHASMNGLLSEALHMVIDQPMKWEYVDSALKLL